MLCDRMKPLYLYALSVILALCIERNNAQVPDVGRIFINQTEYSFSSQAAGTNLQIPFYGLVFRADGSTVDIADNVRVTCVVDPQNQEGYSDLTASVGTGLSPGQNQGTIAISLGKPGRAVSLRCYGESTGAGFQCPAQSGTANPQPQFCPSTSISDPVSVEIRPAPVVSMCSLVIEVSSTSGSFTVTLSENVRDGTAVTVACSQSTERPDLCPPSDRMTISLARLTITAGANTAQMSYELSGAGTCRTVQCEAVSDAQVDGYLQYDAVTSKGPGSLAVFRYKDRGEIRMEPRLFQVYSTTFQSVLILDVADSASVPFQCHATVVSTIAEALQSVESPNCAFVNGSDITTTTPATTTPVPTTTTTTDPSSPWIAVDNSFSVERDLKHHVVRTSRKLLVIAPVVEVVVTTCCAVTNSSRYTDLSVAAVAVADLQPLVCANCSGGVTSGDAGSERFIVNPAYIEVAPCPCDLTYKACDVECCCDDECTDTQRETFTSCIPGLAGGQGRGTDLRDCKSKHFPKDDWFPLTCVEFETNALLGEFYFDTGKLSTPTSTSNKVASETNLFTYRDTESRYTDLLPNTLYKDGSKIVTIYGESPQAVYGIFSLPQVSPSGQCIDTAPVRFLRDSMASCTRTLSPSSCADFTPFSARMYLQASSLFQPACPRSFRVSATGVPTGDDVNVGVNYLCSSDATSYVKSSTRYSDLFDEHAVYSFNPGLQNQNCTEACEDQACYSYNTGKGETTAVPLPDRCSFDSSYDLPPVPSYDSSSGICLNAVLEVRYQITWEGAAIAGITADIIIGNVSDVGSNVGVSQVFNVTFVHSYTGSSNQTDNYQNLTTAYARSGRPGYDFGKPLATGCGSVNATDGTFQVDESEEKQMAVWSPGVTGLCQDAKRRFLTFGDDVTSSCKLRLSLQEVRDCDALKKLVLNHLNVLMPASVVGRIGYNSPEYQNMWLSILREDPYGQSDNETATTTTTAAPTTTTTPSGATNITDFITFDSVRGGVCQNITSGIHLQILYAETGRSNRYPLLEVIGASVSYSLSNWSMSCVGPKSARCRNDSVQPQTFLLTSSVGFTRVSATTPEKPILFYKVHDKNTCVSDTCYRFFDDFDRSICHYDTCWYELFYPLTAAYQGYESLQYTRAFSLVSLIFILGYLVITKPWK